MDAKPPAEPPLVVRRTLRERVTRKGVLAVLIVLLPALVDLWAPGRGLGEPLRRVISALS
jgi:hypothetical protein